MRHSCSIDICTSTGCNPVLAVTESNYFIFKSDYNFSKENHFTIKMLFLYKKNDTLYALTISKSLLCDNILTVNGVQMDTSSS